MRRVGALVLLYVSAADVAVAHAPTTLSQRLIDAITTRDSEELEEIATGGVFFSTSEYGENPTAFAPTLLIEQFQTCIAYEARDTVRVVTSNPGIPLGASSEIFWRCPKMTTPAGSRRRTWREYLDGDRSFCFDPGYQMSAWPSVEGNVAVTFWNRQAWATDRCEPVPNAASAWEIEVRQTNG